MKSLILFSISASALILMGSCSTVYRSGQTPDDIYYSASPKAAAGGGGYVQANSARDDGRRYDQPSNNNAGYYDSYADPDDRWLMMRVRNRARWSVFDDYNYYSPYNDLAFGYGGLGYGGGFGYAPGFNFGFGSGFYSPYYYGLGFGYNSFYNSYWNWNMAYNPYYPGVIIVNQKTNPAGYTNRNFNFNNYTNRNYNTNRAVPRYYTPRYGTTPGNNSTNRRVLSGTNNNSYVAPSQERPVRTYNPSNNTNFNSAPRNSGSPGSSGSSGGSGSRPRR